MVRLINLVFKIASQPRKPTKQNTPKSERLTLNCYVHYSGDAKGLPHSGSGSHAFSFPISLVLLPFLSGSLLAMLQPAALFGLPSEGIVVHLASQLAVAYRIRSASSSKTSNDFRFQLA